MNSLSLGLQPNTLTHLALQKCKCFLFPRINFKKNLKWKCFLTETNWSFHISMAVMDTSCCCLHTYFTKALLWGRIVELLASPEIKLFCSAWTGTRVSLIFLNVSLRCERGPTYSRLVTTEILKNVSLSLGPTCYSARSLFAVTLWTERRACGKKQVRQYPAALKDPAVNSHSGPHRMSLLREQTRIWRADMAAASISVTSLCIKLLAKNISLKKQPVR